MELKPSTKITVTATITPVKAVRIIEVKIPKWKIKSWSPFRYKKSYYKFWGHNHYPMKKKGDKSEW